jgi:hypothetical protein
MALGRHAPVSQRLTALQAAEPQEISKLERRQSRRRRLPYKGSLRTMVGRARSTAKVPS